MFGRMTETLDATDWAILAEVQRDGRIALTELGRRVNLSASATTERVKRLEAAGVITGYRAEVDLDKVGYAVLAVVRLKYPGNRHEPLHRLQGAGWICPRDSTGYADHPPAAPGWPPSRRG